MSSSHIWVLLFLAEGFGNQAASMELLKQLYKITRTQFNSYSSMFPKAMVQGLSADVIADLTVNIDTFFKKYEQEFVDMMRSPTHGKDTEVANEYAVSNNPGKNSMMDRKSDIQAPDLERKEIQHLSSNDSTPILSYSASQSPIRRSMELSEQYEDQCMKTPKLVRMVTESYHSSGKKTPKTVSESNTPATTNSNHPSFDGDVKLIDYDRQSVNAETPLGEKYVLGPVESSPDPEPDHELTAFHITRKYLQHEFEESGKNKYEEKIGETTLKTSPRSPEKYVDVHHYDGDFEMDQRHTEHEAMTGYREEVGVKNDVGLCESALVYASNMNSNPKQELDEPELENVASRSRSQSRPRFQSGPQTGSSQDEHIHTYIHDFVNNGLLSAVSSSTGSISGGAIRYGQRLREKHSAADSNVGTRIPTNRGDDERAKPKEELQKKSSIDRSPSPCVSVHKKTSNATAESRSVSPAVTASKQRACERIREFKQKELVDAAHARAEKGMVKDRLARLELETKLARLGIHSAGNSVSSGSGSRASSPSPHAKNSPALHPKRWGSASGRKTAEKADFKLQGTTADNASAAPTSSASEVKEAQQRAQQRLREAKRTQEAKKRQELFEKEQKKREMWSKRDQRILSFIERQKKTHASAFVKVLDERDERNVIQDMSGSDDTILPPRDIIDVQSLQAIEHELSASVSPSDKSFKSSMKKGAEGTPNPSLNSSVSSHSTSKPKPKPKAYENREYSEEALIAVGLLSPPPPPPPAASYTMPLIQRQLFQKERIEISKKSKQANVQRKEVANLGSTNVNSQHSSIRRSNVEALSEDSSDEEGFDILTHSQSYVSEGETLNENGEQEEVSGLVQDVEDLVDGVLTSHDAAYVPRSNAKVNREVRKSTVTNTHSRPSEEVNTISNAPSDVNMLVIKLNCAYDLPDSEAMGELCPYFVFDWDTLGTAHTQAVRHHTACHSNSAVDNSAVSNNLNMSDLESNASSVETYTYSFDSILKFRLPKMQLKHGNGASPYSLYYYLLYAPSLTISAYNRNESVSDDLIGETSIPQLIDMYIKFKSIALNDSVDIAKQSFKDAKMKADKIKMGLDVKDVRIQLYKLDGSGRTAGCISIDMYLE